MNLTQVKLSCKESKLKQRFIKKHSKLLRRANFTKSIFGLGNKNSKLYNDKD
jgi:hypothetical protein